MRDGSGRALVDVRNVVDGERVLIKAVTDVRAVVLRVRPVIRQALCATGR